MQKMKMTLGKKVLLIYIMCVFFPILLLAMFFTMKINSIFEERTRDNLQYSVEQAAGNINKTIENAENIAVTASVDETLLEILQQDYDSYDSFYQNYNGPITSFLEEITSASDGISEIRVYTDNETIYNSSVYRKLSEYPQVEEWMQELKEGETNTEIVSWIRYKDDIEASGIRQPAIAVMYRIPIYNPQYKYEMAIQVFVLMDQIYYWIQDADETIQYYLINPKNQVVASTDQEYEPYDMAAFTQADRITKDGEDTIVYTAGLGGSLADWTLLGIVNADVLMDEVEQITYQVAVLFMSIIFFSALITILLMRPYTTRLRILSHRMTDFDEADFSPIQTKKSNDEVEIVIQSFNRMLDRINRLINEVYVLNMQKKELELEGMRARMHVLISQVDPHFLFNTLNAILTISRRNHYDEVSWTIEHLALMMRKLLDWRNDQVTVEEEIEFIQMYLDIEKLRFSNRFDFTIEVDPEISCIKIPKMSVQPLVENACKHGFHKSIGHGYVRVLVKKENEFVTVRVINSGEGLSIEQIQALRESLFQENKEEGKGVGLRNVYNRVLLYYKKDTEIIMESENGETCFGFKIRLGGEQM